MDNRTTHRLADRALTAVRRLATAATSGQRWQGHYAAESSDIEALAVSVGTLAPAPISTRRSRATS